MACGSILRKSETLPLRFGSQFLSNETSTGSSITFLYLARLAPSRRYTASSPGRSTRFIPSQIGGAGSRAAVMLVTPMAPNRAKVAVHIARIFRLFMSHLARAADIDELQEL